jgi:hypothetical protein
MKKMIVVLFCGLLLASSGLLYGQKIKSGDFKVLQGQSTLNLQYDYSNMAVGKFKVEEEYIKDGIADRNKKKPGSGDEWAQKWASDKSERFQPMFEKNLNGEIKDCGLTGVPNAGDAKYTLIVRTTFLEQGFQSGVGPSKPAYINLVVDLVETANPGTILATIEYPKVQSANMMGYDYDTGGRIMSCYDRAGGNIGNLSCKNMKK